MLRKTSGVVGRFHGTVMPRPKISSKLLLLYRVFELVTWLMQQSNSLLAKLIKVQSAKISPGLIEMVLR